MVIGSVLILLAIIIFTIYMIKLRRKNDNKISVIILIILIILSGSAIYSIFTSYQLYDIKGHKLESQSKSEEAMESYKKAIEKNENDTFAYNHIISILMQQRRFEEALDYSSKLINIEQKADNYINKGNIEWELSEYENALISYEEAIKIDEKSALAYYGIGMVYFAQEEYDKSFDNFKRYIEIVGDDTDAYYYMGTIKFIASDYENALTYLDKVTLQGDYPNIYIAYFLKGEIYYGKEEYESAIENYSKSVELNVNFGDGYYNLARSYGKINDQDNAIKNLRKAVEISDKFKELAATDGAFNTLLENNDFIDIIK
ncbi:tetratricopeptide repeat protein [Oceanirhabdus sp. W0125-5]|uniref:tetratricopeptide repeat protein n=1 Tax=Oceanirhabdus sp. W0125-5 TaxID=2999116 RepID=UPI0022F30A1A|nr:tetratricopeptide repeat protein [Oceanirhabdus sp. W0125-5]WBW97483.1 tetratricopeptide repeat protein [Oceanirhabdus sp. W0125-5]